jgi:hypothetical protein
MARDGNDSKKTAAIFDKASIKAQKYFSREIDRFN